MCDVPAHRGGAERGAHRAQIDGAAKIEVGGGKVMMRGLSAKEYGDYERGLFTQQADGTLKPKPIDGAFRAKLAARCLTDEDGAIPARIKALLMAVAAVSKGRQALALRELRRGADLGLVLDEAVAGMIVLSSLRGEGAGLDFERVLTEVFGARSESPSFEPVAVAEGEAAACGFLGSELSSRRPRQGGRPARRNSTV